MAIEGRFIEELQAEFVCFFFNSFVLAGGNWRRLHDAALGAEISNTSAVLAGQTKPHPAWYSACNAKKSQRYLGRVCKLQPFQWYFSVVPWHCSSIQNCFIKVVKGKIRWDILWVLRSIYLPPSRSFKPQLHRLVSLLLLNEPQPFKSLWVKQLLHSLDFCSCPFLHFLWLHSTPLEIWRPELSREHSTRLGFAQQQNDALCFILSSPPDDVQYFIGLLGCHCSFSQLFCGLSMRTPR